MIRTLPAKTADHIFGIIFETGPETYECAEARAETHRQAKADILDRRPELRDAPVWAMFDRGPT